MGSDSKSPKFESPVWESRWEKFRQQLEQQGEAQVRELVITRKYNGERLALAQDWLREQELARDRTRESRKQIMDVIAAIAAIVAAVAATIGAIASIIGIWPSNGS